MMTWRDYYVEDERRREMLEDANRQRQIRRIDHRQYRWIEWRWVIVARLGAWMVSTGRRMQANERSEAYSDVGIAPV